MKRHNLYLDEEKLQALRVVAASENVSISDLVREGIDRIIADRLAGRKRSSVSDLQARLNALFERVAKNIPRDLSENEIDDRTLGRRHRESM